MKERERLNCWCGHEKALGEGHVGREEVRVGDVTLPSASCSVETRKSGCW